MPNFSRSWRLLQLMFPGAFETGNPGQLRTDVSPVWDIFRLHIGECFIQSTTAISVGTGADVVANFPEPERARIHVPMSLTGYTDTTGGAATVADVYLLETTNPPDAWGRWTKTAPLNAFRVGAASVSQAIARRLPVISFIPRGNQLQVTWQGTVNLSNLQLHYSYLNCPGEIVSVLPFLHDNV